MAGFHKHPAMRIIPLITAHFALITSLHALDPIAPPGGQRGTDVTVTLKDNNIASFQELITYQPGLTLSGLVVNEKDNKLAAATFHIAPDAALGEHPIRIRTAHGISYLRSFWVSPFPSLRETEPNNTFAEAQRVELNTTVEGIITLEDEDTFVVALKKGQRLSVEAEAMRLGRVLFDASITVQDSKKFELAACDDSPFLKTDPYISIIAPEDGDYRIAIREAAYEGSEQSAYRLHIGTFPRPTSVFPLGGKPGETLDFTFAGDPAGTFTQTITLPPGPTDEFPAFPTTNGETAPSPHYLKVSAMDHITQSENLTRQTATAFPPIPSAIDGILDQTSDARWFRFAAKKGQNLDIRVVARAHRSPLDSVISLHAPDGKFLVSNDDNGLLPDSFLKWPCPADGEYFIQIRDQLKRTGPDFVFRIEIDSRRPLIAATMPLTERNDSQKDKNFPIPRGNRYAAVIQLKRENIGCGIAFETTDLPPGVRLITPPEIPKSLNSFPVIFEAAADAPLGSSLQRFTIRATGEDVPGNLLAPLTDTIHLIEVNNEGTYHSFTADRIPTAVVGEVPFAIELEAPKAPIVRNGKIILKVRASRSGDFKGKLTTKFLWSPAGISSPASVEIAPEKSEAGYELNASADAATGTWQVCVVAEAETPQGRRTVSSQFVPLVIAEPYLNFSLDLAAGQIGKPSALVAKIEHLRDFSGEATAELLSLPHGVTSQPVTFTKDQQEITFPLNIAADAKPGKTTSLLCKVLVSENGQMVIHQTGQGGTLRLDLPPKTAEKPPAEKPKQEAADAKPTEKPLSRLEQLRRKE